MPIIRKIVSKKQPHRQSTEKDNFLSNAAWRKLRQKKIQLNPICEVCESEGIITEAKVVDHHYPRRLWPEHALRLENLTSMCDSHHNKKSRIEQSIHTKMEWLAVFNNNRTFKK